MAAKLGRPTAYKPQYAKKCALLCDKGATNADLADFFKVSITTIKNWAVAHPEFLAAMRVGKDDANERVKRSLYERAVGYTFDAVKIFLPKDATEPVIVPYREHVPPDAHAAFKWMQNRDPENWRERVDVAHSGAVDVTDTSAEKRAKAILSLIAASAAKA